MRMRYQAVIFDLFGTLVPSMDHRAFKALVEDTASAAGVDPGQFSRLWRSEEVFSARMAGQFATQADCIRFVCKKMGASPTQENVERAAAVRAQFQKKLQTPRPEALGVLAELRQVGLKLCLMSVCSPNEPKLWREGPMAPFFDEALFSCEAGLTKPDPRFYLLACQRLGVQPRSCLYVGDGAGDELNGAKEAGMAAVLMCPGAEEDIIMARPGAQRWDGSRIHSLNEVLSFVDGTGSGKR